MNRMLERRLEHVKKIILTSDTVLGFDGLVVRENMKLPEDLE